MPRSSRIVVPGHPHHVIQRGARRMEVFLEPGDYEIYLKLLRTWCAKAGTQVWAYCLMPNHVHLVLVPSHEDGLRAALGETHRRYTRHVNLREEWRGHLWQERYNSFVMDEVHLLACARYVELNPVRANLVSRPEDWRWSSARAHLTNQDDGLTLREPLLDLIPDWREFLDEGVDKAMLDTIGNHARTGYPLGSNLYLSRLGKLLGRQVKPRRPGRPKKSAG